MKESGEEEKDGDEESREEQRPEGESLTLCIEPGAVSSVSSPIPLHRGTYT